MKFLVIGLGSMGRRRIRLLLCHFSAAVCGADNSSDRRAQAQALFGINTYDDIYTAILREKPDAVLVCTPPLSHAAIILDCLGKGLHVFSELNLRPCRYDEIIRVAKAGKAVLFLSATQLYRRELRAISDLVSKQDGKVIYRYHVGQYLPDWHPWDSGREFFAWDAQTNACREILAIELPWLLRAFGRVGDVVAVKDKISALDIHFPDHYLLILKHENGNKGVFIADAVSRVAQRELLVYSDKLHLTWNGTPDSLRRFDIDKKVTEALPTYDGVERDGLYADSIIENAYADELAAFIGRIEGRPESEPYTFEKDLYTLELIDRIEEAGA